MRRIIRVLVVAVLAAWSARHGVAWEFGQPLDLSALSEIHDAPGKEFDGVPFESVACGSSACGPRLYVSGIVGASFASLTTAGGPNSDPFWNPAVFSGAVNDTLFTGGGAIGLAIPRPSGALRVEFEGRGRDLQDGVESVRVTPAFGAPFSLPNQVRAADGWSTLANVWRDIQLTDSAGVYLGGGIGGGGYRLSTLAAFDGVGASVHTCGCESVATFAWQAGTGIFWNVSDRISLDLGYRFLGISPKNSALFYDGPYPTDAGIVNVTDQPYGTLRTAFSASELLLSVRIYEPFRRWR